MTKTVCLISGANRGIGRGLVEALLSRPNTTIIAAVRNPNVAASQSLNSIAPGASSHLIIVKVDSKNPDDSGAV
jgi:norsolorinic acid ketoreductase